MRLHTIAPTLLVLATAPLVMAAEVAPAPVLAESHIAPVFGATKDAFHFPSLSAGAVKTETFPPPIVIDSSYDTFGKKLFFFSANDSAFKDFSFLPNLDLTGGIAVVGKDGVDGTWYYYADGWNQISYIDDYNSALLLAFSPGFSGPILGFRPAAYATSGVAELTFRAVDDITSADAADGFAGDLYGKPYDDITGLIGGSPSYFSAETRTIQVSVTAQNDAPEVSVGSFDYSSSSIIEPDSGLAGREVEISVSSLVNGYASDPDNPYSYSLTSLGVLLENLDEENFSWKRFDGESEQPISSGEGGYLLAYGDTIRITPSAGASVQEYTSIATVRFWDGTDEKSPGPVGFLGSGGGSSAISSGSGTISLTLDANQVPTFNSEVSTVVVFNPGEDATASISVSDSDGAIAGLGGAVGEGGISTSSLEYDFTDLEYVINSAQSVSNLGSSSAELAISFTGLPTATGEIATFGLRAKDDLGGLATTTLTLFGNSAPIWDPSAESNYTIDEGSSLSGIIFKASDPNIASPVTGFTDSLSFNAEGVQSLSLPTAQGGTVSLAFASSPPALDAILIDVENPEVPNPDSGIPVTVSYVPPVNFNGVDSVEIPIFDSKALKPATPLTLTIQVNSINDPPVISGLDSETRVSDQLIVVAQGETAAPITFNADDLDIGDTLTWAQVGTSTLGNVTISGNPGAQPTITFTADQAVGSENLEFTVTDSAGASENIIVPVTVTEVPVAPVITTSEPLSVTLAPGGSSTLALSATDPNLGEVLTWSVDLESELVSITLPSGPGTDVSFVLTANQLVGDDKVRLKVTDNSGRSDLIEVNISVSVAGNQPPTITAPDPGTTLGELLGGTSRVLVARATDPDTGDTLTWSIVTQPTKGTVSPSSGNGSSVSFLYTAGLLQSGADSFELEVADGRGGSARVVVTAQVVPNTPPDVSTPIGVNTTVNGTVNAVAVRGQAFRTPIAGKDLETPRAVEVTISGALPTGITFSAAGNSGALNGIPTVAGSFNFSIALDDGVNRTITPVQLTVVEPVTASVASPTFPVSTPDRTAYGSFLPGSAENFSALAAALQGRLPSQTRAFWWNATSQAYAELPSLPASGTEAWHAVWLASTTPITLPSTITAVAMPYAVDLAPGWTFFGVPPVTDGSAVITTHAWATFQVQSNAGVPLSSTQRADALGNADAGGPFAYDGESYARTTNLVTGAGYWLKNTSGASLRLVRTATATLDAPALRAVSVKADEQPPAPPGGKAAQATDASGGCGAGSGIGLFGLSMAFLFTRLRRRG